MNITDLIEKQSLDFEREMAKVIRRLERNIQDIIDTLRMRDGQMIVSAENINRAMALSKQLEKALRESGYYELAERSLKANNKIMTAQHEELKALLGRERLGQIDTSTLQALQKLKFTGMTNLGDNALIGIREAIFNSVNLGLPIGTLRDEITKKLGGWEKYADTYIRTAKREFSQQVENNAAELIKFGTEKDDIWEYVPNILQANSHKECIFAVNKQYFTNDEKMQFESGGLYSHSEPRWRCVHRFVITNKTFEESFGG